MIILIKDNETKYIKRIFEIQVGDIIVNEDIINYIVRIVRKEDKICYYQGQKLKKINILSLSWNKEKIYILRGIKGIKLEDFYHFSKESKEKIKKIITEFEKSYELDKQKI